MTLTLHDRAIGHMRVFLENRPLIICVLFAAFFTQIARAEDAIVILYPDLPATRDSYSVIRDGIKSALLPSKARIIERPISTQENITALQQWARAQVPRTIITLGRDAYDDIVSLASDFPIVAGALNASAAPPNVFLISLSPHPKLLLEKFTSLMNSSRRVMVVYNPATDRERMQIAIATANSIRLTIVPYEASNIREATQHYSSILQYANPQTDAIWLLDDGTLIDAATTLPSLLSTAWSKRFAVIAESSQLVNAGALLGVSTNLKLLGTRLGLAAIKTTSDRRGLFMYGEDVLYSLNERSAIHLGAQSNALVRQGVDMVFGKP